MLTPADTGPAARAAAGAGGKRDAGVAAIEFAILAPVFLLLVFAIIIYGAYFATTIAVVGAASEGARASVAGLSVAERQSLATGAVENVIESWSPFLDSALATVTVGPAADDPAELEVEVVYDLSAIVGSEFVGFLPLPDSDVVARVRIANGGL